MFVGLYHLVNLTVRREPDPGSGFFSTATFRAIGSTECNGPVGSVISHALTAVDFSSIDDNSMSSLLKSLTF